MQAFELEHTSISKSVNYLPFAGCTGEVLARHRKREQRSLCSHFLQCLHSSACQMPIKHGRGAVSHWYLVPLMWSTAYFPVETGRSIHLFISTLAGSVELLGTVDPLKGHCRVELGTTCPHSSCNSLAPMLHTAKVGCCMRTPGLRRDLVHSSPCQVCCIFSLYRRTGTTSGASLSGPQVVGGQRTCPDSRHRSVLLCQASLSCSALSALEREGGLGVVARCTRK